MNAGAPCLVDELRLRADARPERTRSGATGETTSTVSTALAAA